MNSTDKTLPLKSETAAVEPRKQVRAPAGRMAMFTALRHRNFRLYWIALVSSILARMLHHVTQSWLVLELTNSPFMLGVVSLRRFRSARSAKAPPNIMRREAGSALQHIPSPLA